MVMYNIIIMLLISQSIPYVRAAFFIIILSYSPAHASTVLQAASFKRGYDKIELRGVCIGECMCDCVCVCVCVCR